MKLLENCRLKCSFWWWWKDLIKINRRKPLCCAYMEDEESLILLPWWCASRGWGGGCGWGLPWCRALHLDEAKRVRDVSLMTQTQTSWRMYYRQHAAGHDASNITAYYFWPKIQTPKYKSQWNVVTTTEWKNEKKKKCLPTILKYLFYNIFSEIGVKYSKESWMELPKLESFAWMRNVHRVHKLCCGNVWKGLSTLGRQHRGL